MSLAWIKDINSKFKTFVQNRFIAIRNNVHPDNCIYCSANENPADIITKFKNVWYFNKQFMVAGTVVTDITDEWRDECRQMRDKWRRMRDQCRGAKTNERPVQTSADEWVTSERRVKTNERQL